jgi:hypothetical protein
LLSCDSASISSHCRAIITESHNLVECLLYNEPRSKSHLQGLLRDILGDDGSSVSGLISLTGAILFIFFVCFSTVRNTYVNVILVRFEVFTAVTMKNAVFWDVERCRCSINRRSGGTFHLHLQGRKRKENIRERGTRWRRYVHPKRRFIQYLHGATSKKTVFFMLFSFTSDLGFLIGTYADLSGARSKV